MTNLLLILLLLVGCSPTESEEIINPIIGTWEEKYTGNDNYSFTYRFYENGNCSYNRNNNIPMNYSGNWIDHSDHIEIFLIDIDGIEDYFIYKYSFNTNETKLYFCNIAIEENCTADNSFTHYLRQ